MKARSYEGVFVVLVPQRGNALVEMLREASRQFLGDKAVQGWALRFGHVPSPVGSVAFRLAHLTEPFPWRDGGYAHLARIVSKLAPGRVCALALEKVPRLGEAEGWAEGVVFESGEPSVHEHSGARADLLAWFGEQLSLSENEVLALLESCDQVVDLSSGPERYEDEVDQLLDRARKEFQRYLELKEARERGRQ